MTFNGGRLGISDRARNPTSMEFGECSDLPSVFHRLSRISKGEVVAGYVYGVNRKDVLPTDSTVPPLCIG